MRLECVCSWRLNGTVQSLQRVQLAGNSRDSLILSFLDAKLSVVEYDPETHDLRTVSLHIFEAIIRCPYASTINYYVFFHLFRMTR